MPLSYRLSASLGNQSTRTDFARVAPSSRQQIFFFFFWGGGGGESAPATSTDTLANSKCVTATTIYVCGPPELGATRVPATLHHRLRLLRPMPIKYVCANNRTGRLNRIVFDWSSPLVASSRSTRNRHSTKFRIMFVFFFGTAFLMVLF